MTALSSQVKRACMRFGLWLARLGGWTPMAPCLRPHLPDDSQVDLAKQIVQDVEASFGSSPGPVKAREALRVLMNLRPEASVRDLNLLIELALAS